MTSKRGSGAQTGAHNHSRISWTYPLYAPLSHRKVQTVFLVLMREVDVRVAPTCNTYVLHSEWGGSREGRL